MAAVGQRWRGMSATDCRVWRDPPLPIKEPIAYMEAVIEDQTLWGAEITLTVSLPNATSELRAHATVLRLLEILDIQSDVEVLGYDIGVGPLLEDEE